MRTTGLTLLIPQKPDPERDSVAESFATLGGLAHRLDRFWDPPSFDVQHVRVYGPESFCLVLQHKLCLKLCSPDDDLLLQVPSEFLKRRIARLPLREFLSVTYPAFIKPLVPKQFRAAIYNSVAELTEEARDLPLETSVIVSEIVDFRAEARAFIFEGRVLDAAIYQGDGPVLDAHPFLAEMLRSTRTPRTVVVDVGLIEGVGWAIIEFNAAWGAGLNGCDPDKVLPAILAASEP